MILQQVSLHWWHSQLALWLRVLIDLLLRQFPLTLGEELPRIMPNVRI